MPAKPNEIRIVRVYDAPVTLVWEAWTDPQHVAQWWGPRGFTLTTHHKDFRVGGYWRYTMHGPDGKDWPNYTRYLEIVPLAKMVYDHGASDENAPALFRVAVTFAEVQGKTQMEMVMALATAEAAEQTRKFIRQAGGNSTWDRLAEHLDHATAGAERFIIHRTFDAGPEAVFRMWADPELYARWMGPAGVTMTFSHADFREGGHSRWAMRMEDGTVKHGELHHRCIRSPALFSYEQNFCDEAGRPVRAPFADSYPASLRMSASLAEEEPGLTRLQVCWDIPSDATEAERQTFRDTKPVMTAGWNLSFDKMEALLATGASAA